MAQYVFVNTAKEQHGIRPTIAGIKSTQVGISTRCKGFPFEWIQNGGPWFISDKRNNRYHLIYTKKCAIQAQITLPRRCVCIPDILCLWLLKMVGHEIIKKDV